MLTSTPKKTGRPTAVHKTARGDRIVGLMRLKDGRWRASGPDKFTFTERSEDLAVARFRSWEASKAKATVSIPLAAARIDDFQAVARAAIHVNGGPAPTDLPPLMGPFISPGFLTPGHVPDTGSPVIVKLEGDYLKFFRDQTDASSFWPWLGRLIVEHRHEIARLTGVATLAYLDELKPPRPSPKLQDVGRVYQEHATVTERERAVSEQWWKEFSRIVGVATLREVTTELVVKYHDAIMRQGVGAVSVGHRFGKVKTILNFAKKRGLDAADCRNALDACAVLVPPAKPANDPHPIGRNDFHALLAVANDRMKAAMLLALNGAFYGAELADLRWSDIRGDVLVTIREKTKKLAKQPVRRAAVLWTRTIEALDKIKPDGVDPSMPVFRLEADTIREHWQNMRVKALVDGEVKFNHIRDGAYTAAVEGEGVEFQHCQVLAGHRCGMADKYVARRPRMVERACAAIESAYFG